MSKFKLLLSMILIVLSISIPVYADEAETEPDTGTTTEAQGLLFNDLGKSDGTIKDYVVSYSDKGLCLVTKQDVKVLVYHKTRGLFKAEYDGEKYISYDGGSKVESTEVVDISDIKKYVKDDDFAVIPKDSLLDVSNWLSLKVGDVAEDRTDFSILVFSKSGKYIDFIDYDAKDIVSSLYDSSVYTDKYYSAKMKIKKDTSDDKQSVALNISLTFDEVPKWAKTSRYIQNVVLVEGEDFNLNNVVCSLKKASNDGNTYVYDATSVYKNGIYSVWVNVDGKTFGTDNVVEVTTIEPITEVEEPTEKIDDVPAKVTFSELGSGILSGTWTNITLYTDKPCIINFNGESSGYLTTEYSFLLQENGEYEYSVETEDGIMTSGIKKVDCFVESIDDINFNYYGDGTRADRLPQTGGTHMGVYILFGVLFIVAGVCYFNKDKIASLVKRKEVN